MSLQAGENDQTIRFLLLNVSILSETSEDLN